MTQAEMCDVLRVGSAWQLIREGTYGLPDECTPLPRQDLQERQPAPRLDADARHMH